MYKTLNRNDATILVNLPVYNEAGGIEELLARIKNIMDFRKLSYKVILYDDGSTDNSISIIKRLNEKLPLVVIEGQKNMGLGIALSRLIEKSIEIGKDEDIAVMMDSDNTHNPEYIFRMIEKIRDGFDIVIASRYQPESRIVGLSLFRQALSHVSSVLMKSIFPIQGARDYTCGYRAYNMQVLKDAYRIYGDKLIEQAGFACMAELLIKLSKLGVLVTELPLILRYDHKIGQSKMQIFKTSVNTLKVLFKLMFTKGKKSER
jgi:dolichol-phosphate mannosyltransferase